jgi:hypothetical protein
MKKFNAVLAVVGLLCVVAVAGGIAYSQAKPSTVQVHMVITDQALNDNSEIPILSSENVQVKQGKNVLRVEQLVPARDDNAALQLFVLIDDTCDTGIGNNLNDLRDFINAQPATTMVGVAYMSNATIQIVQNLTTDHAASSKAVRLPRGIVSTMDSPYLSLISLLKSWPQQKLRREVLMVSDGIDRLRGEGSSASAFPDAASAFPTPGRQGRTPAPAAATTMPTMSADADVASVVSQRSGVIVHSVYSPGVGRLGRNAWEAQLGQSGIAKITDETGGEYYALGTQNPVSFKPYLDRLQKVLDNQYFLVFQAVPKKKEGLQRVSISTEAPNAELASANNVWVPAAGA